VTPYSSRHELWILSEIEDNVNCLTRLSPTCPPQNLATLTHQHQIKFPNNRFPKAEATPTNQSQSRQSPHYQCYRRVRQFLIRLLSDKCCLTQSNSVVQFVAIVISVKTRREKLIVTNVITLNLTRFQSSSKVNRQCVS
jgi:hypothetical protein